MKILLIFMLLLSAQFAMGQIVSKHISEFTGFNAAEEVLIDVRTPAEFNSGCIDGAVNIDWLSEEFNQKIAQIDSDKKIYVYCKKGGRSLKSQERLAELGFKNVINLEGGYDAFSKK
ncbi:MAG: rhodanese-like domain-containing protein [Maribacter sp.]